MKPWDYAELSRMAKEAGGPAAFIKMIKDAAKEAGVHLGRIQGSIFTIGLLALLAGIYKLLKIFFGKKETIPEQEVKEAEKNLINGINEYDKCHQAEQTTTKEVAYEQILP